MKSKLIIKGREPIESIEVAPYVDIYAIHAISEDGRKYSFEFGSKGSEVTLQNNKLHVKIDMEDLHSDLFGEYGVEGDVAIEEATEDFILSSQIVGIESMSSFLEESDDDRRKTEPFDIVLFTINNKSFPLEAIERYNTEGVVIDIDTF